MELQEFIAQTIQNIEKGIEGTDFVIGNQRDLGQKDSGGGIIDFDVCMVVTDADVTTGGGKLQVFSIFKGELEKEIGKEIRHSSRIKFQIKRARTETGAVISRPLPYRHI